MRLEQLMPLIKEQLAVGQNVRFKPRGISMLPMLRQGVDSVVLSPLPEKLRKYDIPLYQRDDGNFVLHRIVKVGKTYTCIGDNQFELERGVRYDQMIAVVSAFYRGEEYHTVAERKYRRYVRIRHFSRPLRYLWRKGKDWLKRHL